MAVKRDKLLRDAEKLVQKGKLEQAIKDYEKILRRFPDDTTIINRVGDLYGRVGQLQRAIELYENIADHFTKDGFTTKAIAILKKIQRLDPQRLDIFERLAELYFDQGLMIEAKREYQILADWYVKNGELEKAINAHEKLVDLDPGNHVSSLRLADLLLQRKEITSALKVYDRLGSMLLEAGKLDEAERLYRHIIEQEPPDGEFLIAVCRQFLDSGRAPVVLEFLTFGVEKSPESVELNTLLVRTHLTMGEATAALEIANKVLDTEPENAEMRSLVGNALLDSGDIAEAREMLLPAIEAMLEKGDPKSAQSSLKQLLQEMPEDQEVLRMAVRAYRTSPDQETLFTLKAALAESYFQSGEEDGAKRLYVELLESDPTNQEFRERMAMLDGVEVGDSADGEDDDESLSLEITVDEAIAAVDEEFGLGSQKPVAVEQQADAAPAPATFDLKERMAEASVFAKYGLIEKAISHLEDVVLFSPEEMEPRQQLALLYAEHGDRDQAIAMAKPVVEHHRQQGTIGEASELLTILPELGESPSAAPMQEADAETAVASEPLPVSTEEQSPEEVLQPSAAEFVDEDSDLIEIVEIEGETPSPSEADLFAENDAFHVEIDDSGLEELVEQASEADLIIEPLPEIDELVPVDEELVSVPPEEDEPSTSPPAEEEIAEPTPVEEVIAEPSPAEEVIPEPPPAEEVVPEPAPAEEVIPEPPPAEEVIPEPAPAEVEPAVQAPVEEELPTSPPVVEELVDELVEISDTFAGPSMGDLEQIDFFLDQELFEDAARVLSKLEEEHGEDPEVVERRRKLKEVGFLLDQVETVEEGSEELFADEEQYIDLAKELEEELAAEEAMVEEATGRGKGEAVLEEVFREFQKGVAEQLSDEDSDTHFNLGIAYREMGLLPEAIREFQVASRDPGYYVESCSIIGVCYQEQGMWSEAAEWYQKALVDPELNEEARRGLRYDLASTYEALGEMEQAFGIFEELVASDPEYRDVSERLSALSQHRQAN
jgi:tetratricopeptide (TPR) repeat protein